MPAARMRMRQWLQMMIESGSVPGLVWVDKEKHMFSIPWKHAARHGWQLEKDASLFKLWAVHTGKHVEGQTCDPKTWKANFRCALNSLPDIEEVKDRSINKGHQAMRVFRMLPAIPRVKVKRSKTRELAKRKVRTEDDTDDSDSQSPAGSPELRDDVAFSTQENLVDSTVHVELQGDVEVCSVPDTLTWPLLDELRPSSFSNGVSRGFEISPDCSPLSSPHRFPDYSYDIIEICQQMEKDPAYSSELQSSELQSSQPCTSPGSLWSESSGDDLDDLPQYTTLGSDIIASSVSDLWNNLNFSMT